MDAQKEEMLRELNKYVDRFINGITETIGMIRTNQLDSAKNNTVEIVDGLGWIVEGLGFVQEELGLNPYEIKDILANLAEKLGKNDFESVADLFEDGLLPVIRKWHEKMNHILNKS